MHLIEELEEKSRQKLVNPSTRCSSEGGVFFMPTTTVQEWYLKGDIPSAYRGLYLNPTSLLQIIISDKESYKAIKVMLAVGSGKYDIAHYLQWQTFVPRLESVTRRGWVLNRIDTRRPPTNEDYRALINCVDSADSYNLSLPLNNHPVYHPQPGGILLPNYPEKNKI
jgi:hypothetical protein